MLAKEKGSNGKSRKRARVTVAQSLWDEWRGSSHPSFAPDD